MPKSIPLLCAALLAVCVFFSSLAPVQASTTSLDLTAQLGSGLTSTSNPNPNNLTVKSPYPTPYTSPMAVSAAWTSQGRPALFPAGQSNGSLPLKLHFVPSAGATVTYTVTLWMYDRVSNTWVMPFNTPSNTYTGEVVDYISQPGNDPIFIQINAISNGSLSVIYDSSAATAL